MQLASILVLFKWNQCLSNRKQENHNFVLEYDKRSKWTVNITVIWDSAKMKSRIWAKYMKQEWNWVFVVFTWTKMSIRIRMFKRNIEYPIIKSPDFEVSSICQDILKFYLKKKNMNLNSSICKWSFWKM